MAKRRFRPEDALRLKAATDPDLSPDGRRVAFSLSEADEEADRLRSSIWVVAADGSSPPRRFSEGPAERMARWSPDGRWLAYLSVPDDKPQRAHVRLAPLDGGAPVRLGDLPGPVLQFAWAPDSLSMVVVCRVGMLDREKASARERNAPRRVRGLAARFDGVGWQEGRRHLFIVDVPEGAARQLTRGEFDHLDPSFSPDGAMIVFAADRGPRRDDRQVRCDAWMLPATGGRPRRLTNGKGWVSYPLFSPDGRHVAFAGQDTDEWNADGHVFVVPADAGNADPERVAPQTDRPTLLYPGLPPSLCWTGERELAMLIANRGRVEVHRARLGEARSRAVIDTETQVDGLSARVGRRVVAFTASWADVPSELYISSLAGGEPRRLTSLNDEFIEQVELAPVNRRTINALDGTEVEYFSILPSGRTPRRLALHVDVHGGPHAYWPSGRWLA